MCRIYVWGCVKVVAVLGMTSSRNSGARARSITPITRSSECSALEAGQAFEPFITGMLFG